MKLNYLVGIVLAMQWIIGVSTIDNGPQASCCTTTSKKRVRVTDILSYLHQEERLCPTKAIRFLLVNGKTVCSDPDDAWAKHAIKILDGRTTLKTSITSPSSTSTRRTHTTTSTSSPGTSTESTTTMTTPKATSTTWKSPTHIPHTPSPKQPLRNTNKPFHWTTKQITTAKMITTTTPRNPTTTSIETTSVAMTTKLPVITTTPKGTSTIKEPTTHITHRPSTKQPFRNTNKPFHWTTKQITTKQMTAITERKPLTTIKTTSTTSTTESPVTTPTTKGTSTTGITHTVSTKDGSGSTSTARTSTRTMTKTVQTTSTMNGTRRATRCPPRTTRERSTKKIPWTVRRLRKKSKVGLRRAQMKIC